MCDRPRWDWDREGCCVFLQQRTKMGQPWGSQVFLAQQELRSQPGLGLVPILAHGLSNLLGSLSLISKTTCNLPQIKICLTIGSHLYFTCPGFRTVWKVGSVQGLSPCSLQGFVADSSQRFKAHVLQAQARFGNQQWGSNLCNFSFLDQNIILKFRQ